MVWVLQISDCVLCCRSPTLNCALDQLWSRRTGCTYLTRCRDLHCCVYLQPFRCCQRLSPDLYPSELAPLRHASGLAARIGGDVGSQAYTFAGHHRAHSAVLREQCATTGIAKWTAGRRWGRIRVGSPERNWEHRVGSNHGHAARAGCITSLRCVSRLYVNPVNL